MGKIGIMGGTFDPIHNGHLMLGRQAYEEYGLDEIWYMPSGQPPHKKDHDVTPGEQRLFMTKLAIENYPGFVCSDFELKGSGNTYTADTLRLLGEGYPGHQFYFIIGADSLYEIEKWHEPRQVMAQAVILVAPRAYEFPHRNMVDQAAYLKAEYGADIRLLHCEEMPVSSADLRSMVCRGRSIAPFVPESVASYICRHHLYKQV